MSEKKPHKHAELIKAWADGAEIESRNKLTGEWVLVDPFWEEDFEYRIKPEAKKPVARWLWADKHGQISSFMHHEGFNSHTIKLEWSRTEFPE